MRELELQLWGPRPLRELELQPLPEPWWDRVLQGRRLVPPRKQTRLLAVVRRALVQAVAPQVLALASGTVAPGLRAAGVQQVRQAEIARRVAVGASTRRQQALAAGRQGWSVDGGRHLAGVAGGRE